MMSHCIQHFHYLILFMGLVKLLVSRDVREIDKLAPLRFEVDFNTPYNNDSILFELFILVETHCIYL